MALNTIKCERMTKCANMAWCDGRCFAHYPCYRPTTAAANAEDPLPDKAYAHAMQAEDDAFANREVPVYGPLT